MAGRGGGGRSRGSGGGRRRSGGGRRWFGRGRKKKCVFCVEKTKKIDYKKADEMRQFLTDRGKIQPRRRTGTCAKHQRIVSSAIKRARHLALLPYVVDPAPNR